MPSLKTYVDTFEKEEEVDLNTLLADMKKTEEEIEKVQSEFIDMLKELTSTDKDVMASLNSLIEMIEG